MTRRGQPKVEHPAPGTSPGPQMIHMMRIKIDWRLIESWSKSGLPFDPVIRVEFGASVCPILRGAHRHFACVPGSCRDPWFLPPCACILLHRSYLPYPPQTRLKTTFQIQPLMHATFHLNTERGFHPNCSHLLWLFARAEGTNDASLFYGSGQSLLLPIWSPQEITKCGVSVTKNIHET